MSGFSFSFSKKASKPALVVASKIAEKVEEDVERCDIVTAIDGKQIESKTPVVEKQPLVIPCIQANHWRTNVNKRKTEKNSSDEKVAVVKTEEQEKESAIETLDDIAKRELLAEAKSANEEWEARGPSNSNRIIPILMRNAVPEGYEEDDNFDVSARAENPTAESYEQVPVEEFGLAMLRGMGWKEGEAVGGKMKAVVAPIEVTIRPKGLGLGAEAPKPKPVKATASNGKAAVVEDLELKRNCHVFVELGEFKGFYGTVESIDDDMIRASVKLLLNSLSVMIPIAALRVVSKKEFTTDGKMLNKSSYEQYKSRTDKSGIIIKDEEGAKVKEELRGSSRSWLAEQLRVRIIDKKYHSGKYYKEKVVIKSVSSDRRRCSCRTSDKIRLDDLTEDMLETVIPRDEGSNVLILRGEHKGALGTLVKRENDESIATVKLKGSKNTVKLHYDYVCEFVL